MEPLIFEGGIKYDRWVKVVLVFPLVLFIILGILFYIDARYSNIFPKETARKAMIAAIDLFIAVPLVLVIYRLSLPRKIYIFQDYSSHQLYNVSQHPNRNCQKRGMERKSVAQSDRPILRACEKGIVGLEAHSRRATSSLTEPMLFLCTGQGVPVNIFRKLLARSILQLKLFAPRLECRHGLCNSLCF